MRRRRVLVALAAGALTAWSVPSRADDAQAGSLGQAGQIVVSATRLVPLVALNAWSVHTPAPYDGPSGTEIETGNHPSSLTVYDIPRLGIDWLPAPRFALGVDVGGFATLGGGPPAGDPAYVSIAEIAPRVGTFLPLTSIASVWLRAGVAYYVVGERGTDGLGSSSVPWSLTWKQLDADVEAYLVVTVLTRMAITGGLVAELPLTGSFEETRGAGLPGVAASASWLHVGLTGGLLAYLDGP